MKITTQTFWGPNPYSTRPCVIFCFEEIAEKETSTMMRSYEKVANYLKRNFKYSHVSERKTSFHSSDVFDFLSSASIFILNYVRGDLEESGFVSDSRTPTVFVEFHQPDLTAKAVKILLHLLFRVSAAKDRAFNAMLHDFWDECLRWHPDFQAHALIYSG